MPRVIFKKMPKTSSRKIRNQRRASMQASPAPRSNLSDLKGGSALPRLTSSNDVASAFIGALDVQGDPKDVEGRYENVNDNRSTLDKMMKDDVQRSRRIPGVLPSNKLLADFDSSAVQSTIHPPPTADNIEVPKHASLLGIPIELRIMIFKRVFPRSDPKGTAETTLYCEPNLRVLGQSHSQLCRVNRQIYEETRGLLYGQTLVFLSRDALTKFSSTRSCQQMSQLRSICMKRRVTDWAGAIKTLVLPPGASLTVHWPIARGLWQALTANITLDYRQVNVLSDDEEQRVVFEPATTACAKRPTYEYLQRAFSATSS